MSDKFEKTGSCMSFNMRHKNKGRIMTDGKYEMVMVKEYSWEGQC